MIENLLNLLRQRQPQKRYEGRHRAEPPQQRQPESNNNSAGVN